VALNKKTEFETRIQSLSALHKALSHPARLAILETLAERQSCVCGEIVDTLPLAQATVSQHLRELKESGLIKGEIEGKTSCYCLDWGALEEMEEDFKNFFEQIKKYKMDTGCC